VERLNRELSKGQKETRTPAQQLHDLLVEWYCLGPLPNGTDELRLRFQLAEEKLGVGQAQTANSDSNPTR
jgi:hypothetical protein